MKHVLILAAAISCLSGAAGAQTSDVSRREITAVEDAWRTARIAGDTAFLEKFYAKEGRIQGMDGKVQSRDAGFSPRGKSSRSSSIMARSTSRPMAIRRWSRGWIISAAPPSAIMARCSSVSPTSS